MYSAKDLHLVHFDKRANFLLNFFVPKVKKNAQDGHCMHRDIITGTVQMQQNLKVDMHTLIYICITNDNNGMRTDLQ